MAKRIIKFDGEEYSIEETKFDPTVSKIAQFLTEELAGTGVTISLGGKTYSVDGERISTATDGFTSYLESIEGDDINVKVSGTTYGLSRAAVEDGYETVELTLAGMADGDTPVEPELPASEGLEFELNDDGQSYYVSGIGTCTDNEVVIPSYYNDLPVTDIYKGSKGRGPFNKENVYSIVLPNTFTKISDGVFLMHYRLQSVTIPNSVTTIEDNAFNECTSLTSITIPNSVTSIDYGAFAFCNSLTGIIFEGTVEEWNTIEKGEEWKYDVPATYVQCTDGQVTL